MSEDCEIHKGKGILVASAYTKPLCRDCQREYQAAQLTRLECQILLNLVIGAQAMGCSFPVPLKKKLEAGSTS
jgi:hypothetical protein